MLLRSILSLDTDCNLLIGDTEDATFVDTSYAVYNDTFPPISAEFPYPEASAVGIGKDFYALSANLPEGTLL